jgi:hypothetical protein
MRHDLSIRAAVMNCLARCSESEAPLCCLGDFLDKLGGMGWSCDDVSLVEKTVLRILCGMRETATYEASLSLEPDSL